MDSRDKTTDVLGEIYYLLYKKVGVSTHTNTCKRFLQTLLVNWFKIKLCIF